MAADDFKTVVNDEGKLLDAVGAVELPIDARRFNRYLLLLLLAGEVCLVIIDAAINYQGWITVSGIQRMANIAREDGLGTWFMTVQTLAAGVTIFLIYLVARARDSSRGASLAWLFLSLFFFFMAIDDAVQIHERLGSAFSYYAETGAGLPGRILDFFPSYPWQLIILPFFAAGGIFMLFFLWQRLRDNHGRAKLVLALACFVTAIILDFVEGLEPDSGLNLFMKLVNNSRLSEDFVYHFAKVIEEFLEMLAMTLLLSMFFMHLSRSVGSMRFRFVTALTKEH